MAQSTSKTKVTTHTAELTQSFAAAATKCTLKNRTNEAMQWSFNKGVVANGGNVIGPYCVIKDVPIPANSDGKLYFLGYNVADSIEVEYT